MRKSAIKDDGTGQIEARGGLILFGGTSRHKYENKIFEGISKGFSTNKSLREYIESECKENFNEIDISTINDGSLRWIKNLNWKKFFMKNDGFIQYNKKKKTWDITKKGLKRYNEIKDINNLDKRFV